LLGITRASATRFPRRNRRRIGNSRRAEKRNRGWRFYIFIGGGVRFMFAWDADPARVDALARDIRPISAATWRLAKAAASVYQDS
jgi:hypothetical protein